MSAIVEKFLAENPLVEHAAIQGTPEWKAARANLDGSSEAAAMLGLSKKTTRSQLMHMKYTGDEKEFSQWVQENILDHGHRVEAMARPIVEAAIGGKLYPVMQSRGRISASCDGLRAAGDLAWEHKQWNTEYAALVDDNILPEEHAPQCYQILLVTGADRLIFTISDGTDKNMASMSVLPDQAWFERIILGWAQFNKERAEYVPPIEVAKPVAAVVGTLPAVKWNLQGTQITSNLEKEVKPAVLALIDKYSFTPETDQDFADLKAFGENARDAVIKSKAVRETVLANLADINAFNEGMLELEGLLTQAAITAENVYKAENNNRKNQLRAKGQASFDQHINALQASIKGVTVAFTAPDLAAATKNMRTLASFGNAVKTCVGNAIVAADVLAADVSAKLDWYNKATDIDTGHFGFLFKDLQQLIGKPLEDFQLVVTSRIEKHKADEAAKLEAERVRMEAEAKAKAELKAAVTLAAEEARIRSEERAKVASEHAAADHVAEAGKMVDSLGPLDMNSGTGRLGSETGQTPHNLAAEAMRDNPPPSPNAAEYISLPTRGEIIRLVAERWDMSIPAAHAWLRSEFSKEAA